MSRCVYSAVSLIPVIINPLLLSSLCQVQRKNKNIQSTNRKFTHYVHMGLRTQQLQRKSGVSPEYFCEQLRRQIDPEIRRKPTKKLIQGLEPSVELLKKLEVRGVWNAIVWYGRGFISYSMEVM